MPRKVPMTSGSHVNSRNCTLGGMYGRKFVRYGLSGWNPIRSGYSCAAAASPGVITSLDIGYDLRLVLQSREKGLGKDSATLHGKRGKRKAGQEPDREAGPNLILRFAIGLPLQFFSPLDFAPLSGLGAL